MLSPSALVPNEVVARDTLAFFAERLRCCTLCGAYVPVPPLPRCRACGRPVAPFEGIWAIVDEATGRTQASAWMLCHAHAHEEDRAVSLAQMDTKLRQRYGFVGEERR
ncbi:MAG TPA: hypothetical protein VLQ80_29720 [Candidatus Saccharimonadia bacterium]|nr:hypothetical protein [Candidatus Saccharimonadia bacterium]